MADAAVGAEALGNVPAGDHSYGDWGVGSFVLDSGVMLITQSFFFAFGWVFFMRKLFRDYEVCMN